MRKGDRLWLSGGYDMEPQWLRGRAGYYAKFLYYVDNGHERRSAEGQLSALVEFDETIEFGGITGKFGLLDLRWKGQVWEEKGTVHVILLNQLIKSIEYKSGVSSHWMESHATYEVINDSNDSTK